jgi:hypothetical protein
VAYVAGPATTQAHHLMGRWTLLYRLSLAWFALLAASFVFVLLAK